MDINNKVSYTDPGSNVHEFITGDDVHSPFANTSYAWKALLDHGIVGDAPKIADFGAGTGFLAHFAKTTYPNSVVKAYENNAVAFEYLEANNQSGVICINEDVANVSGEDFNYIMATPPTLPETAKKVNGGHILEPEYAIFPGDERGRSAHEVFVPAVAANLAEGGVVSYAHTEMQADFIKELMEANGLTVLSVVVNEKESPKISPAVDLAFTIATK